MSQLAGLTVFMRVNDTSLDALHFCCNIQTEGREYSDMGGNRGGGGHYVDVKRQRQRQR